MDFLIFVLCVALLFTLPPLIRYFFKRVLCMIKIKRICRKKKYKLHKTHPLWFLGGKYRHTCDCYVETPKDVFSIKFFGIQRRIKILIFKENNEYYTRRFFVIPYILGNIWFKFDGDHIKLPDYDFKYKYRREWEEKALHKILLVNPITMTVRTQSSTGIERNIREGDMACGMEMHNLSNLIRILNGLS